MLLSRPAAAEEAPRYAVFVGARASWLTFGYRFYNQPSGTPETTGEWTGDGVAPEIDLGARLARRYVPYVTWEHGFMARGHHFAGTDATTSTNFYGGGVRYLAGDVDGISPLVDLSLGKRVLRVSYAGQTYEMSGVELFRLGLGAEVRLTSHMVGSALVSFSTGSFTETEGDVDCRDCAGGHPPFVNGRRIDAPRTYVTVSIGGAIHFDLF